MRVIIRSPLLSADTTVLECLGVTDIKVLPRIGLVLGAIDPEIMEKLRSVPGIEWIEEEGSFSIPPML